MERRVILFIVLTLLVIAVPVVLFPPKPPVRPAGARADSGATTPSVTQPTPAAPAPAARTAAPPTHQVPAETVWVTSPLYRLGFSTHGARLVWAELLQYRSFAA